MIVYVGPIYIENYRDKKKTINLLINETTLGIYVGHHLLMVTRFAIQKASQQKATISLAYHGLSDV